MSTLRTKIVFEIDERDIPAILLDARKHRVIEATDPMTKYTKRDVQSAIRMLAIKAMRSYSDSVSIVGRW